MEEKAALKEVMMSHTIMEKGLKIVWIALPVQVALGHNGWNAEEEQEHVFQQLYMLAEAF